jgi:hypothetical protein
VSPKASFKNCCALFLNAFSASWRIGTAPYDVTYATTGVRSGYLKK